MSQRVVSIVLTWNSKGYVGTCLESLMQTHTKHDIWVVDNNSADGTAAYVQRQFPGMKVIQTGANLGYAGANNVAMQLAVEEHYDYAFIVNPDLTVAPDCLDLLLAEIQKDPKAALACPKVYYSDGYRRVWYAGAEIDWSTGQSRHTGLNEPDKPEYSRTYVTERACGAAMLVDLVKAQMVGLMDEAYFLYFEETDLSVRLNRQGYRVLYVGGAETTHAVSSASGGEGGALYQYYMTRNNLYFMKRFATPEQWRSFTKFLLTQSRGNIVAWSKRPGSENRRKIYAIIKGYRDFYQGRFGRRYP